MSKTRTKKAKEEAYDAAYEKLSHHEQILLRPDTYVGSFEQSTEKMWVYNSTEKEMELRVLTWVPGLYKIFDEILVNAADNREKDSSQSKIKVEINREKGFIKVWNNGQGIPVHMHSEHKLFIPDMIFGHLLTSGNYKDDQQKTTGGRNGLGAKLANIFSTKFILETCHGETGKKFKKTWTKNMYKAEDAIITDSGGDDDYTSVTFWPDWKRFGMDGFDDDTIDLFNKRVIDIAGVTDKSLKVYLNGKLAPVQDFQNYVELFPGLGEEKMKESYASPNARWQICIRPSNIDYQQISFVNSIWTIKGGKHVQYIVDQAVTKVSEAIAKKNKKVDITATNVKPFLWVFVNARIVNPAFDSQTKETLNTPKSKFGSTCEVPQKMIDSLVKVIHERVMERVNNKLYRMMASKAAAGGKSRLVNVPKLDDANDAGTRRGSQCTLILTEGDSAKSMVISGLGKIGRDRYGVFPLRGKPLNVREASTKQVTGCKEVQNLMKIIGLKPGQKYTDTSQLRYGSVMIMTDQDHDGSHIKGLLINMFHFMWPELLTLKGFLVQFITPIVKGFKKGVKDDDGVVFFTIPDFLKFKTEMEKKGKKYDYKYYKGLGTSSTKEAKEYFSELDKHQVDFVYDRDGDDDRNIELAFSKKMIEDRKRWITNHKPGVWVDYNIKMLGYSEFINKELILFSIADCERSIPSVIDGLKPGQRKILFGAFKRNLTREIKVAQFSGYVSEHGAYHHGEKSLQDTITNMAQNFTGGNNLPFLKPCGQFGSRAQGGKDHASARYIFTKLDDITRCIFPKVDDNLLSYKDDDGKLVEPEYYIPIIPTCLLNGQAGIGTGFATNIPNYNPQDLINAARALIKGEEMSELTPWYRGFNGTIRKKGAGKYVAEGVVEVVDSQVVRVVEVPVKYWTDDFKDDLTKKLEKGLIVEFRNHITGDNVDVDVALRPDVLAKLVSNNQLINFFDLRENIHCSNLICFDKNHVLHKYNEPEDIVKEWYLVRLATYVARKKYLIDELTKTCIKLKNMVRFINEVNDGSLQIRNRKKAALMDELAKKDYAEIFPQKTKMTSKTAVETDAPESDQEEDDDPATKYTKSKDSEKGNGYEYLLGMKLWSVTYEKARQLEEQLKNAEKDLDDLKKKAEKDMWLDDLDVLETTLKKTNKEWEIDIKDKPQETKTTARRGTKKAAAKQTRLTQQMVKAPKLTPEMEKAMKDEYARIERKAALDSKEPSEKKRKVKEVKDDDDEEAPKKKPRTVADTKAKRKPAAKKGKKKKDSDTEESSYASYAAESSSSDSDTDSSSSTGSGSGSDSSDDDLLASKKRASRKPAPKAVKKPSPKKTVKKPSPKKETVSRKRAMQNLFGDNDSDDEYAKKKKIKK